MASINTFKSGARYGYRVKGLIVHGTVQSFHGPAVHASHAEAQRAARREINQINHEGAQIRAAAPHPADYDNPRFAGFHTAAPNPRGNMATARSHRRSAKARAAYKGAKKGLSGGHWSYIAAVDAHGRNCLRLTVDGIKTDKYVYSPAAALAAVAKLSQGKQTMVSNPRSKKRSRRKSGHKGNVAALRTGMSMMKHAAALYRNGEVPSVAAGMKVLAAQARPNPKHKGKKKSGHKGNVGNLTKGQSLMKRAAAAYHAGEYPTMAAAMKGVSRGSARSNPYYRILR